MSSVHLKRVESARKSPEEETAEGDVVWQSPRPRVRRDGKFLERDGRRLRIQGVTYGPFAPDSDGQPFPDPERVREDFLRMRDIGINTIRTYHLPPEWLLGLADEQGINLFLDIPWPKHLCFLDSAAACRHAREAVRQAVQRGRRHPCLLAYSVGNEIPPAIVRWHGSRRVERFLAELYDAAKQADPEGLATYASYPPTEYLDLSCFDFVTFNVYLHERETFRRYLFRLQNLVGDKPLVLGEIGMDTLRHGEIEQANFLAGHIRETILMGLAGAFIFSWTDDWHTGGQPIHNWAFGITHADRSPKAAYHALREIFNRSPAELLPQTPRVSVVVCTYNGGRTLEQCLRSLRTLDYPDYEAIVVDDGSTDNTREILARFPEIKAIHQNNRGLSFARNVGLNVATGSVVVYTDSDCFADPDWLSLLVEQLQRSGAAAVGGPNLSPEDGWLASCVAASPGQPVHVLESDQVAEHIPGCNMAFRREALQAINGFDYQYKKAGDDVDICWRLQQAGQWITFAPGSFVWHHRRQAPRSYLRQQAGYGEAEALLRFKHPDKFNGRGDGKWRGILYGASLQGLRLSRSIIYRGTFAVGFFQCLYQPGPAHWAMLPTTLEWHLAAAMLALAAILWPTAWVGVAAMLALSLAVAALLAGQAQLPPPHRGFKARCLIMVLSYLQPLVRSWARYHTRFFAYRPPQADPRLGRESSQPLPLFGCHEAAYWTEDGFERTELLGLVIAYLNERGWGKTIDSGWSDWDLEVYCHPWTIVQVNTAQEEHGGTKRLIRVRYRLRASRHLRGLGQTTLLAGICAAAALPSWPLAACVGICLLFSLGIWWRGMQRASQVLAIFDTLGASLGLLRCHPTEQTQKPSTPQPAVDTKGRVGRVFQAHPTPERVGEENNDAR